MKGCQHTKINFKDAQFRLHKDVAIEFKLCPVGGHNYNGKVEQKICEVKQSIEESLSNKCLSILQWETLSAEIANSINNLPLALQGIVSDFKSMDLITPNRLKLGRNNDRSPSGPLTVTRKFSKILEYNKLILNAWFDCWLINHVPKIIQQLKWFHQDQDTMVGDSLQRTTPPFR